MSGMTLGFSEDFIWTTACGIVIDKTMKIYLFLGRGVPVEAFYLIGD
jgi:hypothetical protein